MSTAAGCVMSTAADLAMSEAMARIHVAVITLDVAMNSVATVSSSSVRTISSVVLGFKLGSWSRLP